jgi:hypothetical protein
MRRTLGNLTAAVMTCLALGVTAGCGSSSSTTATDSTSTPTSDPSGNPTRGPGPIEGAHVLPLISMTGAGGQAQPIASPLNTRHDVAAFARQFRLPEISARIQKVVNDAQEPGHDLVGQIVMVGCDRPPGVVVNVNKEGQVELVPEEVASPLEECLAAVTTVAIAVLPRG